MTDSIIAYFGDIPSSHRTLLLIGGLLFFWSIEGLIPIVRFQYKKLSHGWPNIFFTGTTAIVNLAFAFLIVKGSDAALAGAWGILNWIALPFWMELILGLMLLDLIGAYLIHWIQHQVHWMWKFHVIHHSDAHVDASTALRHHPGESLFRAVFTLLAVLITGAPMWLVMLYQSASALLSQFNHSNIKLPRWVNTTVGLLIVTPDMHRVHHHDQVPYTDMNYGNIFPFWDKIFGTFGKLKAEEIHYGLDVFNKRESHLGDLLGLPFDGKRYRKEK